ncbi:PQQ-binding-like beta-propeller repeat protein [Armatimonas rosea]|uniref:Outer membrane protein assembly factor BamB n=1 Tax=Armatimonas rosea TaxID=685828 RepID=A0A7W9SPV3_ARMRO|nr:PQQ-binding-like beta-propeller repeat protein [Armatimonas rosea]MBB6049943.1 outer membrane protein assembly factor BamB [Armatimonas rosea]
MRFWPILVGVLLLFGTRPAGAQSLAAPPYVRQWSWFSRGGAEVFAVEKSRVYYTSRSGVGALELATGKLLWGSLLGKWVQAALLHQETLFALAPNENPCALYAVHASTGKSRLLVSFPHRATTLAHDANSLYVLDEHGKLWAVSPLTGKVLWSTALVAKSGRRSFSANLLCTKDSLYVGLSDVGEIGLDSKTGKVRWSRKAEYAHLYPALPYGDTVITRFAGLQRTDIRTGKIVWKKTLEAWNFALIDDVLILQTLSAFQGYQASTCVPLWHYPTTPREFSLEQGLSLGKSVLLHERTEENPVAALLTSTGKELWKEPTPFTGTPVYAESGRVITDDGFCIRGYTRGTPPSLPATEPEKKALAERLASHFEQIDNRERKLLERLKPYTFPPFLAHYLDWARRYDAKRDSAESQAYYSLIMDARPYLLSLCEKENTEAMVAGWKSLGAKSSWRRELESVLQEKGDPAGYVPILVASLKTQPQTRHDDSAALSAVAHSSHSEAVAFLIEALRDPKAPPDWRREAFRHLAGTGGVAGAAAVREARAKRVPRKPWYERLELSKLEPEELVATKKDTKGRTWLLFHSAILGNRNDLFLVEKRKAGTWGTPLFTGIATEDRDRPSASRRFSGIPTRSKFVKTEWIKRLPDDPTLRRDSDGDGLTDLVEQRLGLSPKNADTDGDGLRDGVDPCPNVAPRPLDDTEKILAACVEAYFFAFHWDTPSLFSLYGVTPFELYGSSGVALWHASGEMNPLFSVYEGGVNLINFYAPGEESKQKRERVAYSADRQSARVMISRYAGGLDGDTSEVFLKKIEGEWFVVDFQLRLVS